MPPLIYRFADIEIDPSRRELRRGGELQAVEPKVLDVLIYLIGHRDRVVPKRELLDQFWPHEDTSESALNICIHRCRRAIGEDRSHPMIRTLAGRGYRMVAAVQEAHAEAPVEAPSLEVESAIIGRGAELKRIQAAVRATQRGAKRVLLITGEPGIGKSRLLSEAGHHARAQGMDVLWTTASDHSAASPFGLWRTLLTNYAAWYDRDELRAKLGGDAGSIVRLAPDLAERLRLPRSIATAVDTQDRQRLFGAVARFLTPTVGQPPLAMMLDDLDSIGLASLRLLEFLAGPTYAAPLLIVGAYRADDFGQRAEAVDVQSTLRGSWVQETLALGPLNDAEVGQLVFQSARGPVAAELVEAVVRRAEGQPLVAIEHWHQLVRAGIAARKGNSWVTRGSPDALPRPSRDSMLLTRRLAALGTTCRQVLEAAAVLGRETQVDLIARVVQRPPREVVDALEEAAQARLLRKLRSTRGAWRFTHGLVREHVYAHIDEQERAALHRRAGEALAPLAQVENSSHLPLVAQHFLDGATAQTAGQAVSFAYQAGLQAFGLLAYEKAIHFFEQGLAMLDNFHPAETVDAWYFHFGLAEACIRLGNLGRARTALQTAARRSDHAAGETAAAPEMVDATIETTRLLSIIRTGLAPDPDGDVAASMQAAEQRRTVLQQAVAAASATRDLQAMLAAQLARRWNLSAGPAARERLALSTEAQLLAEQVGRPQLQREATLLRINDLLETTQRAAADHEIARMARLAEDQPDPVGNWMAAFLPATQALLDGRFAEGQNLAMQAMMAGGMAVGDVAASVFGAHVGAALTAQGRSDELIVVLETMLSQQPHLKVAHATLARAYCESERLADAQRAFAVVEHTDFSLHPIAGALWPNTAAGLARVCNRLGAVRKAAELYEQMLPYRGNCIMAPPAVVCVGSAAAYLAMLAATAGHWQQALELFEESFEVNARMGARPVIAHTQYELARLLRQRDSKADHERADSLLREAEEVARELDMPGLLRWISALSRPA